MFTLTIKTDNEAFTDMPHAEVARIMRELAHQFERFGLERRHGNVRDVNGNTVGNWSYAPS